ncbi:ABC transporter substrate-binding protein [Thermostichus vulcanus]|uniref:ABC transporter substrate-binding protein n=1 Tax=Thermostichus vulcanus str. 'Rupite' TaxID=2813851 RepID=A0ABT0CEA3_THEVL|nr:ABC transporter substrate-binding protein [Thermostichus vulcanus]MCJ2544112.1 ABC transporter substrate-binding protein [Thermostichus vulcanus str. 'Rupite']
MSEVNVRLNRRQTLFLLGGAATAALASITKPAHAARELVIAEPVHSVGYLPMYVAVHKGYFEEENLKLQINVVQGGGAHAAAVLTGDAWGMIGGPEHCAYAKARGGDLRAVVNVVNRGNVYINAKKGVEIPTSSDWGSFFQGKRIFSAQFGGTPNSILRYLLKEWELDPVQDVTLIEGPSGGAELVTIRSGQADLALTSEPVTTQGIKQGIWDEPFYNVPKELGPYAFSTINIRKDSLDNEPEVVESFVRAIIKGLAFVYSNSEESTEIAREEFPTMALEDLQATLNRSFADELWSPDGIITPESWQTAHNVVRNSGNLTRDVAYEEIIEMKHVRNVIASL